MYTTNLHRLSLLALALGGALAAQAEEGFDLGRIEVTAERPLPALGSERIEAEQLRAEQREDVAQALDALPGVTLTRVGARNEAAVYVRGFDLRQVPLYIDGVPVYVPYDGYVDLGRFTTFDLAEVNLEKGFSSVLYGANTLGGAINLVSRRPQRALEGEVGVGYTQGSESGSDSKRSWVNLGSRQGRWYAQLSGAWLDQESYALSDDYRPAGSEDGGLRDNAYRTDTRLGLKLGYTPRAGEEYALGYVDQNGEKGTPPYAGSDPSVRARYWQWPYWDKQSLYLISRTPMGEGAYLKTRLYHDTFENALSSYDDASYTTQNRPYAFQSWYDDYSHGASVEYGVPLGVHLIKLAAHYKLDHHEETNLGDPALTFEDRTYSLGLEDTLTLDTERYLVFGLGYDRRESLRADDYDGTTISPFSANDADTWNPQVGYFARLDAAREWRLSLAMKSRFPTIKDRYSYRLGSAIPNPDLAVERATTLEFGWVQRLQRHTRLDATLFYSDIRDLIQSVDLDPNTYQLQNIGKVRAYGGELALTTLLGDALLLSAQYSHLNRDNRSSDLYLTGTPKQKLAASLTWYAHADLDLSLNAQHEGARYSSSDGTQVAAFTLLGLRADWRPLAAVTARLGVSNLADVDYAYQEGYPEAGRTWYANLAYRF